jgi:ribosome-associated translation inhibitor RaiA
MDGLEIKGIEFLNEEEKHELNKEIEIYKEKLKWKTKSNFKLKLAIKIHSKKSDDKNNKRKNYSLRVMLKGETHSFEAEADDWDFHKALHKLFDKLLTELEHAYRSSEQHE